MEYRDLVETITRNFNLKRKAEEILLEAFNGYTLLVPAYKVNIDSYVVRSLSQNRFPDIRRALVHHIVNELYYNSSLNLVIQNMRSLDLANNQFAIISTNTVYLKDKDVGKFDLSSIKEKKKELKEILSKTKAKDILDIITLLSKFLNIKVILGVPIDDVLILGEIVVRNSLILISVCYYF